MFLVDVGKRLLFCRDLLKVTAPLETMVQRTSMMGEESARESDIHVCSTKSSQWLLNTMFYAREISLNEVSEDRIDVWSYEVSVMDRRWPLVFLSFFIFFVVEVIQSDSKQRKWGKQNTTRPWNDDKREGSTPQREGRAWRGGQTTVADGWAEHFCTNLRTHHVLQLRDWTFWSSILAAVMWRTVCISRRETYLRVTYREVVFQFRCKGVNVRTCHGMRRSRGALVFCYQACDGAQRSSPRWSDTVHQAVPVGKIHTMRAHTHTVYTTLHYTQEHNTQLATSTTPTSTTATTDPLPCCDKSVAFREL